MVAGLSGSLCLQNSGRAHLIVTPAKAGVPLVLQPMKVKRDSRLRGNDENQSW